MKRGKFITFEGGDGVGKSTQIELLAERLRARGIDCLTTREPGGTPFAERVRDFILAGALPPHSAMAEALLFGAARHDHVSSVILPALILGHWVLSDRFSDSTRSYQGAAGGADKNALMQLDQLTHAGCQPDLTVILDLDPAAGRARIADRSSTIATAHDDPFEARDTAFHARLRAAFLEIAHSEPARCKVINAEQPVETIATEVWDLVADRFGLETA